MKNRTEGEVNRAFQEIHDRLSKQGYNPKINRIDNECSKSLKEIIKNDELEYQLVPPHVDRRNLTEREIKTLKDHFIAGLATIDPKFPVYLWCRLLPQATVTLNIIRQSRIHPSLSAYQELMGGFDYNKTHIALVGVKVIIREKPATRQSWAAHGINGWYISPAMEHYMCHKVYATETRGEKVGDPVEFFPQDLPMPKISSTYMVIKAAVELTHALKNPTLASPFHKFGDDKLRALDCEHISTTRTGIKL